MLASGAEGLPGKEHRGIFWSGRHVLSLDRDVRYTNAYLYQIDLTIYLRLSISLTIKYMFF